MAGPTCAHDTCGCAAPTGERHCGPYCANAGVDRDELPPGACACGHDPCTASHRADAAGPEERKSLGSR